MPPIQVVVQNDTPLWLVLLPIGISLFSLAVSGWQFVLNHAERKRVMPSIKMVVSFTDVLAVGTTDEGAIDFRKVVMVKIHNVGREGTTLNSLDVFTDESRFDGLGLLLDNRGNEKVLEAADQVIPGFARVSYKVNASFMVSDNVTVTASFGHGLEVVAHARLNRSGKANAAKLYTYFKKLPR